MDSLHGYYLEDLSLGMSASYSKTITEADVNTFAKLSGDNNPVHVNAEYAATTIFKERIAHGMFSGALISTVLGTQLPGPGVIYLDQQMSFKAPVLLNDTVTATVTITEINEKRRRVTLETTCQVGDKVVTTGTALMMVDRKPSV